MDRWFMAHDMGPYDRFLIGRFLTYGLGATLVLTMTIMFSQSQRLFRAVTDFGMPLDTYLWVLMTQGPYLADLAFVAGTAIGAVFVFLEGRRARTLLIAEALGMSPWRRFLPVFLAALILIAIQLLLSMVISPPSSREHQSTRREFRSEVNFEDVLNAGTTIEITPTTSIFMDKRIDGQNFYGIRMFDSSIAGQESTIFANRGSIYSDRQGLSILLFEGFKVDEREGNLTPIITTFSALPIVFDRNDAGFSSGRLSVGAQDQSNAPTSGQTRGSAPPEDEQSKTLDLSKLRPEEFPASVTLAQALLVMQNLDSDQDFTIQPIRVPSNEFHRRLAAAVALPIILWLMFTYLATDHHLRRPPIGSLVTIAIVTTFALLAARVGLDGVSDDPRVFPIIYLGAVLPVPFILIKILLGKKK